MDSIEVCRKGVRSVDPTIDPAAVPLNVDDEKRFPAISLVRSKFFHRVCEQIFRTDRGEMNYDPQLGSFVCYLHINSRDREEAKVLEDVTDIWLVVRDNSYADSRTMYD